jgi:hypothetical protein
VATAAGVATYKSEPIIYPSPAVTPVFDVNPVVLDSVPKILIVAGFTPLTKIDPPPGVALMVASPI